MLVQCLLVVRSPLPGKTGTSSLQVDLFLCVFGLAVLLKIPQEDPTFPLCCVQSVENADQKFEGVFSDLIPRKKHVLCYYYVSDSKLKTPSLSP